MHKFFVEDIGEGEGRIHGEDHRHLFKVLRLTMGARILVNNLEGQDYLAELTHVDREEARFRLLEALSESNESPLKVHLYQGLPKAGKMDLIVQKATELGVTEVVPIYTQRVVLKEGGAYKKLDRLKKIMLEAAKQSRRSIIPDLSAPQSWADAMTSMARHDLLVVPYENATGFGLAALAQSVDRPKSVGIVIGPEGGFDEAEIEELKGLGGRIVTLGRRILRTETAGFTTMVLLQYLYGDLGGDAGETRGGES